MYREGETGLTGVTGGVDVELRHYMLCFSQKTVRAAARGSIVECGQAHRAGHLVRLRGKRVGGGPTRARTWDRPIMSRML